MLTGVTNPPRQCRARQASDQMMCGTCGLQWDTNDPDPPECPFTAKVAPENEAVEWADREADRLADASPTAPAPEVVSEPFVPRTEQEHLLKRRVDDILSRDHGRG